MMLHFTTFYKHIPAFFRAFSLVALMSLSLNAEAQNIIMTNGGNSTACAGTFLDPGGTGNYSYNSTTFVHTICSANPGEFPVINFTSFNIWTNGCVIRTYDELKVYDGPNTSSPLIATYETTQGQGKTLYGASGCLTFQFIRNTGSGLCASNSGAPGWAGTISCVANIPPSGENCFQANPFCSDQSYSFPNATSGTAPVGPKYGCLQQQPKPIWYYLKIGQAGTLQLDLAQTNTNGIGTDVDFAMWGPFTDLNSGCSQVMAGSILPLQCSYSASPTETIGIGLPGGFSGGASTPPQAQVGEYYIVLLTNFAGSAGTITLEQSAGTGATDCSIMIPCNITTVTASPGTCDPATNQFSVSGQVTFVDAPTTGNLIVEDCNGNTATYSAPFTSPLNYTISGITSDNMNCNVTAYFSDELLCTKTSTNYQNPPSCACVPPVLTINNLTICSPTTADLNTAIDATSDAATSTFYASQADANNAANPITNTVTLTGSYWVRAEVPGNPVCFSVYEIGVNVTTVTYTASLTDENCGNSDGQIVLTAGGGAPLYTYSIDNGTTTQGSGTFSGLSAGVYNILITDDNGCSATGTENIGNIGGVSIDQLTTTNPSCHGVCDGDIGVTLTGGTGTITYVWSDDNGATIGSNSATIANLCAGNYTVTVTDANNCSVTGSPVLTEPALVDASFDFDDFCNESTNAATNIATAGGTFIFNPAPLDLATVNSTTAEITNATDGATYTVQYTTSGACPTSSTQQVTVMNGPDFSLISANPTCGNSNGYIGISGLSPFSTYTVTYTVNGTTVGPLTLTANGSGGTVIPNLPQGNYSDFEITGPNGCSTLNTSSQALVEPNAPSITAPNDTTLCMGEKITLSAINPDGAAISWNNGAVDGVEFTAGTIGTTTYTVTATINNCTATDQVEVTVHPKPTPSFVGDDLSGCAPHTVTFLGSSGVDNASCNWDFGDGSTSTACDSVTHTYTESGVFDVTLAIESVEGCENVTISSQYIQVFDGPIASFTANPMVTDYNNTEVVFTNTSVNSTNYLWDFGDYSAQVTDVNPVHNYPIGVTENYFVTLYAFNAMGCIDSISKLIEIGYPLANYTIPNVFTPNGDNDNDFFKLINNENIPELEIIILNRWGNLVFESTDVNFNWNGLLHNNGSECSDGTYFYKIRLKDMNGDEVEEHGFVQLSRGQ